MRKHVILIGIWLAVTLPAAAAELPFHGFLEVAAGTRVVNDEHADDDVLLEEARFQFDFLRDGDHGSLTFRADLLHDGVTGESSIDVREANVALTPLDTVDLKLGRQVLTWGTGDLIFLNDLFPKDWQSFFIGRDDEYLKQPSDAVRATWYGDWLSADLAWLPVFEPDGYISGERISFWGGASPVGPADPITPIPTDTPDKTLGNSSLAGRMYATLVGWETALYGYRGHYGQPKGFDGSTNTFTFPRLEAWGASTRGTLLGGIANAEVAWYRSLDDKDGNDPTLPNSEFRALAGFSHELATDQNLGLQAYLERAMQTPAGGFTDQNRWWFTARYTGMFLRQNLICSLFAFYSPSEDDAYLRPKATYKLSDEIQLTGGANWFIGVHPDTFFGQFEDNTNLYARVRYSF
ncbi:MAG TPA: hypothetical protein VK997_00120 [Deferrisomatales bacterium]|nr:hypothetical protein [Deferrisomatales bacterium]